ncbi:unnamed protein product [Symbiodinium sp. CCMP2592]|nr:unnamed protein product [Symbiodinium sp. CCMP2592]
MLVLIILQCSASRRSLLYEASVATHLMFALVAWASWFVLPIHGLPSNRYVLCGSPPVTIFQGSRVKGFAASVAGSENGLEMGRMAKSPYLRVALLVDADWEVTMPGFDECLDCDSLGHSSRMSYKKCKNQGLHRNTEVSCRLARKRSGLPNQNGTWLTGRLMRYRNNELALDFAECDLADGSVRWIHEPDGPGKINVEMRLQRVGQPVGSGSKQVLESATMLVELCLVRRPLMRLAFCAQTLYNLPGLQREVPWVVEDWLHYHMEYLGIEHAQLYDIDGSLEAALENWTRSRIHTRSFVSYEKRWPSTLSDDLARLSTEHPFCTEMHAYAHCATTQRALSRWVLMLHSPDEYVVPNRDKSGRKSLRGSLPFLVEQWESNNALHGHVLGMLAMKAVSFARGGPGSNGGDAASQRGAVLHASMLRSETFYHHAFFSNPEYCVCMGPHTCYHLSEEHPDPFVELDYIQDSGSTILFLDQNDVVMHHYVEMTAHDRGRCATLLQPCNLSDRSMEWAVKMLRRS